MMTRAYDKFFLPGVMNNLGFAVDFAVNGCGVSADIAAADSFVRFDRTPEYWAVWILAYYQWETNLSFLKIRDCVPFSQIINMYEPLHEAPQEKFVDVMNDLIKRKDFEKKTNLHNLRKASGLTQKELSELTGVNLRTLQQYEIGSKDINKASGQTINSLALALHCNFYDVMELSL